MARAPSRVLVADPWKLPRKRPAPGIAATLPLVRSGQFVEAPRVARIVRRGEFVGPGEELTAAYLEENLPDDWLVICNKELPREASSRELDLLIVGDHALFAVEEKHWPGTIRGNEDGWILPTGESEFSPLRKLEDVGKRLRQKLEREVGELKQGQLVRQNLGLFVLLSHPDSDPQISDPRAQVQVLRLRGCEDDLLRFDAARAGEVSIAPVRSRIIDVLERLPDQPEIPATVGPFAVTERVETIGPVVTLRATHDDGSPRVLKLIRRQQTLDAQRRQERERLYRREYDALTRLANSGVVPRVDPYFFWDQDQFLVIPLHVPRGRTLRADAVEGSHPRGRTVTGLIRAAFRGLAELHQHGVVHRALSPDRIVRVEEGGLCFTDLNVARISGEETVAAQVAEIESESRWRAPECAADPALAGPKSDVWSLAACLVYWILGMETDEPRRGVHEALSAGLDLDEETFEVISQLLNSCLADNADDRPTAEAAATAISALPAEAVEGAIAPSPGPHHEGFTPGQLLDRRYRIERILGAGATATSYLALDTFTDSVPGDRPPPLTDEN
jgi:tRNA A-37 threonylcarbamoyl transferase component Bud32